MAITTLDQLLAGSKPRVYFDKTFSSGNSGTWALKSTWGATGIPGPGTYDTTLNGAIFDMSSAPVDGMIYRTNPVSGNAYLSHLCGFNPINGGLLLVCDRLWNNGGISMTSTATQAITSPTWPARDMDGATAGRGVMIGCESSTGAGTNTTLTLSYTNSAGVAGQSVTLSTSLMGATNANAFGIFTLNPGDLGVRSVQSIKLTGTMTSGQINLVAYRLLAALTLRTALQGEAIDCLKGGFPRLFNGTVPFFVWQTNPLSAARIQGWYGESQG